MSNEDQRRNNRRAIFGSLLIWGAVLLSQQLNPFGLPPIVTTVVLYSGLLSFVLLILWPWIKDLVLGIVGREDSSEISRDSSLRALVNFEIIALSSVLLLLLFFLQHT